MFSGTHSLNSDWGTSYFHDFLTWHVLTHGLIFRAPFSYTTCQYGCVHRYIQLWKKIRDHSHKCFLNQHLYIYGSQSIPVFVQFQHKPPHSTYTDQVITWTKSYFMRITKRLQKTLLWLKIEIIPPIMISKLFLS